LSRMVVAAFTVSLVILPYYSVSARAESSLAAAGVCPFVQVVLDKYDAEMPKYKITDKQRHEKLMMLKAELYMDKRQYIERTLPSSQEVEELEAILAKIDHLYFVLDFCHFGVLSEKPDEQKKDKHRCVLEMKQTVVQIKSVCPAVMIPSRIEEIINAAN